MAKYINADDFLLQYSILTSRPNFTPLSSEMSAWKLWKQEFDRDVVSLISRMVTEREDDEQKFIAKIKEIPFAQIPIDDIVRCKDCKKQNECGLYLDSEPEWFCADGERREDE